MLTQANENIKSLIREVLYHRKNANSMYCCFYAQREDNSYICNGVLHIPEGHIEVGCEECKQMYWKEMEDIMLEKYIVR